MEYKGRSFDSPHPNRKACAAPFAQGDSAFIVRISDQVSWSYLTNVHPACKIIPRVLKPITFGCVCGAIEVVACYKAIYKMGSSQ
jgi:hypothetical protein